MLYRAERWHAFCSGTLSIFGILSICMGIAIIRMPFSGVLYSSSSVTVLLDFIFMLLAAVSLACCSFALILARSVVLVF